MPLPGQPSIEQKKLEVVPVMMDTKEVRLLTIPPSTSSYSIASNYSDDGVSEGKQTGKKQRLQSAAAMPSRTMSDSSDPNPHKSGAPALSNILSSSLQVQRTSVQMDRGWSAPERKDAQIPTPTSSTAITVKKPVSIEKAFEEMIVGPFYTMSCNLSADDRLSSTISICRQL